MNRTANGVSRRRMLQVGLAGAGVVSMGSTIPRFLSSFAFADQAVGTDVSNDNILVVVQMSGGNDGLNTVAPINDDVYRKSRPVIGLTPKMDVHKVSDDLVLNPGMVAFKQMFDQGGLAIVNGCGYPQPNRSHFRSMEIWQTANPKESEPCGWLGHYVDHFLRGTENPVKAVNVGSSLPQALVNEGPPVPSLQGVEQFRVNVEGINPADSQLQAQIIKDMAALHDSTPALQYLSRQATNAILSTEQIRKLSAGYKPDANYPQGGFATQLKLIAQMISAKLGTRIFYCQIGGFDTHSNQFTGHQNLLGAMTSAIKAFHDDLTAKGFNDKVMLMTFSEFGRRVHENGSAGTDHGAAAPMFLTGGKVNGGLFGAYPTLADLDDGDLKYTTDFRRVYATLLDRWLNVDSTVVLNNKFEALPLIGTGASTRPSTMPASA